MSATTFSMPEIRCAFFKDGQFTITHFCGSKNDLHGSLIFSADFDAAVDLYVEAVDVSDVWEGAKYPKAVRPGDLQKLELNRLTISYATGADRHRPADYSVNDIKTHVLTLARAHAGFERMPANIRITVQDADGHPVPDASIFSFMSYWDSPKPTTKPDAWKYAELAHTDAAGVATVTYEALRNAPIGARDSQRHLIGYSLASPAALQDGTANVTLRPECHVRGTLDCPDLAGKPIGWTNVYLFYGGERIGLCTSHAGAFDFFVRPGHYRLSAYGEQVKGRYVDLEVPEGQDRYSPPMITLASSRITQLTQQAAPELTSVLGWKGSPTRLADLHGKLVLLDFWGYWCHPCVVEMPNLIRLHERFKGKGLAVIGIHVDMSNQVDTTAKLDEKLVGIKTRYWNGKDLPFPVALTYELSAGAKDLEHSNTPAAAYGIDAYPTTIAIDRKGNLIGVLDVSDEKLAAEQIQKWLDSK